MKNKRLEFSLKRTFLSVIIMDVIFYLWDIFIDKDNQKELNFYIVFSIVMFIVYFLMAYFYEWKKQQEK